MVINSEQKSGLVPKTYLKAIPKSRPRRSQESAVGSIAEHIAVPPAVRKRSQVSEEYVAPAMAEPQLQPQPAAPYQEPVVKRVSSCPIVEL